MAQAVVLTEKKARALTERIRKAGEDFGALLLEAHDGEAWRAMGYASWTAYVDGEFEFTRRTSYRLLTQQRVNKQLAEAGSDVRVTQREAEVVPRAAQIEQVEQAVYERRSGPVPKPTGKRRRGFTAPDERVREDVQRYQGWYEMMDPDYPVDPSFVRVLSQLRDVIDSMLGVAEEAARKPIRIDEWSA